MRFTSFTPIRGDGPEFHDPGQPHRDCADCERAILREAERRGGLKIKNGGGTNTAALVRQLREAYRESSPCGAQVPLSGRFTRRVLIRAKLVALAEAYEKLAIRFLRECDGGLLPPALERALRGAATQLAGVKEIQKRQLA